MVTKYNRYEGVPKGCHILMRITAFGDFGHSYKDEIVAWAYTKQELNIYCERNKIPLDNDCGWSNEYFITEYK